MDKKTLEDYRLLEQRIRTKRARIEKLKNMAARWEYAAVRGSNPEFPYQPVSFHVSGYNIRDDEKKQIRIHSLMESMKKDVAAAEQQRLAVEEFIENIPDMTDQLIFTYMYLEGMTQEQAAEKLYMDQSRISRRISKYFPKK